MKTIKINDRMVGGDHPTYFIADISANHDGDLGRAKELIRLAAEAGANAAKFQNFRAKKIVSDFGFRAMEDQISHQASWKKSVFDVYDDASISFDWTPELKAECDQHGIDYFSSPYDFEAVDMLESYVPAYKIGSGDITWPEMLRYIAKKGKPVILASGASEIGDVHRAVDEILEINSQLILMQCNTNYTASQENFKHIHLNVLKSYASLFPDVVLGLSDHTPEHATVLGAVALGARAIEKHFTDDTSRIGPDHPFSMNPKTWKEMVDRTRELEQALGSPMKHVAENEKETVVIQQRCLRAARDVELGETFTREMIDVLRPAPIEALRPYELEKTIGMKARASISAGEALTWTMLSDS
jgi:N-acetylneuraminate synthase